MMLSQGGKKRRKKLYINCKNVMRNHYGIREKRWRQHISGCVSYQLIHIEKVVGVYFSE
jgi:hypothetical protein